MFALFQAQGGQTELRNFFTVISPEHEFRRGITRLRLIGLYRVRVHATATKAECEARLLVGEYEPVDQNAEPGDICELTVTEPGLGDHRPQSRLVTLKVNQWFTVESGTVLTLDKVTSRHQDPPVRLRYEFEVGAFADCHL